MIINNNEEKASISVRKIIGIFLLIIFLSGICVLATNTQVNTVKIVLSSDYEMDVMTSKTKVSEILDEKHIILLPDEKVTPNLDEELTDSKTITISKLTDEEEIIQIAENNSDISIDSILQSYNTITEKVVVEEVSIPYETITKDVSSGSQETTDRVVQQGQEGIKKITYKVKYQNDIEIEKTEISSEIIKEPVSKIIQVRKVTSRSAVNRTSTPETTSASGVTLGKYKITAYCSCAKCCGKSNGITASGRYASANHTIAAPGNFPIGTKLKINGVVYTVEDRGGAINGKKIDVYVNSHSEALRWGVRYLEVELLN